MESRKTCLIAYRKEADNQIKIYAVFKNEQGKLKIGYNTLDQKKASSISLSSLLEIDSTVTNKVFVIKMQQNLVMIMNSVGEVKTISFENWQIGIKNGIYFPVNKKDAFNNTVYQNNELETSSILQDNGNVLIGKIYAGKVENADVYDMFSAVKITGDTYRLDKYVSNYGKSIIIPKYIQIVDENSMFIDSNKLKLVAGKQSYNTDKQVEEIRLEQNSQLKEWQNKQFRGQSIFLIDFSNQNRLQIIGENTFQSCEQLTEVKISSNNNPLRINNDAFNGAINLKKFDLSSVIYVGERQLKNTDQFTDYTQTQNIRHLGEYALDGQGMCGEITFLELDKLRKGQISNCQNIEKLVISVKDQIEEHQIYNNNALKSIEIIRGVDDADYRNSLITLKQNQIAGNERLKTVIIPENTELKQNFVIDQQNIRFIGNTEEEYKDQSIVLRKVKINSFQFKDLFNIKRLELHDIIGEIPKEFAKNLWVLYSIKIDDQKYIPNPKEDTRMWLQLTFANDSGYCEDKSLHRQKDTIRFIHSQKDQYVMLCKFKRKPITQQIFVIHDQETGKAKAIQIVDSEWKKYNSLVQFQRELKVPKITIKQ